MRQGASRATSRKYSATAGVAVAGDQQAVGAEALGDGGRMAAGAEGGVEGGLAGRGLEQVDELIEQDRRVGQGHLVLTDVKVGLRQHRPPPPSACDTSPTPSRSQISMWSCMPMMVTSFETPANPSRFAGTVIRP